MDEEYILTLLQLPKIGRKTISRILSCSKYVPSNIKEIKEVLEKSKVYVKGLRIPEIEEIHMAREKAYEIKKQCEEKDIKIITSLNEEFPKKLRIIQNPPVILFYRGNFKCIKEDKSIAIIGSRKSTEHGKKVAERLGNIFGKEGFVIVTGLALGCDEYAHIGCLETKGRNVAVLPCGLDNVYPAKNKKLAEEILENGGCIISEYCLGVKPLKYYFVERDRLQSALSKVVIVVETTKNGGTMHTAGFAIKQKKSLYCYVHPPKYQGIPEIEGNRELLLKKKALPLRNENDIETIKKLTEDYSIHCKEIEVSGKPEQISMQI